MEHENLSVKFLAEEELPQERMSYYIISKTGIPLWRFHFWRIEEDTAKDMMMSQYLSTLVEVINQFEWDSHERNGMVRWGKFDCRLIRANDVFLALHAHNGSEINRDVGKHLDDFSTEVVDEFQGMFKKRLNDDEEIGSVESMEAYDKFDDYFTKKIADKMKEIDELYKKALVTEVQYRTDFPEELMLNMMQMDLKSVFTNLDALGSIVEAYEKTEKFEDIEKWSEYTTNDLPKLVKEKIEQIESSYKNSKEDGMDIFEKIKNVESAGLLEALGEFSRSYEKMVHAITDTNDKYHSLCQIFKIIMYEIPQQYKLNMPKISDIKNSLGSSLAYGSPGGDKCN